MILPLLFQLAAGAPFAPASPLALPVHDALHYDFLIQVGDTGRHIVGQAEILLRIGGSAPIVLDLDRGLRVVRVISGGRRPYAREGDQLIIPHERQRGDTMTVRVRWHGEPTDGFFIGTNRLGERVQFADNYPDRARRWLPVQDHPGDKATVRWHVDVPPGVQAVANGALERVDTLPRGRTVWHWSEAHAVPTYVMVIGVAPFARTVARAATCDAPCLRQEVWTYHADSAWAMAEPFHRVDDIAAFLARLVAPFPYEELKHVESTSRYGGMENAAAIFYGDGAYERQRLGEATVAHETAHQWFGDAVTPADFTQVWLSEGFATYYAALWVQHAMGDSAFRASLARDAAMVKRSPTTARPILEPIPDTATSYTVAMFGDRASNSYQKAGWVLHMLRGVVGDSAFHAGIRAYWLAHRDGNVRTTDLLDAMSAASGKDLRWFFHQALEQPGFAQLAMSAVHDARARTLTLTVRQAQPEAWGLYRMPGFGLEIDGVRRRIDIAAAREQVIVLPEVARAPAALRPDPDGWWLADVTVGPAPR